MTRIAVVGLGLMGGSLVRRLAASGTAVAAWSPEPGERTSAAALPGVTAPDELDQVLEGVDGVVLATPLSALPGLIPRAAAACRGWIQDVASLQVPPLRSAAEAGCSARYISAHPMAGSEARGFDASRDDLYAGARVWLSAGKAEAGRVEAVEAFWTQVGADPRRVGATEHDRRMTRASHLPQVLATHLAALLADAGIQADELGPGGRDMTRLAGSGPAMWKDILEAGGGDLPEALRTLAERLREEADRLERGEAAAFARLLARTGTWRAS